MTYSQHYILFARDPGIHIYFTLDHGTGDRFASIGQIQWVFRGDLSQFTNTYDVNTGLGNLGARTVPANLVFGGGGRGVQDATDFPHIQVARESLPPKAADYSARSSGTFRPKFASQF